MKNKLLAASIVASIGVLGSGIASAMEFSVYGSIRGGYYQQDTDDTMKLDEASADDNGNILAPGNLVTEIDDEGRDASDFGATGSDGGGGDWALSRFGFRGSEELGNGASAGFHIERGLSSAATNARHENVWISGNWGKLTFGQQSNPYRNAANWDQSWFLGGNNRFDDGGSRNEGIRYDNSIGPFSFSLMATASDVTSAAKARVLQVCEGAAVTGAATACNSLSDDNDDGVDDAVDAHITVTDGAVKDEDGIDSFIATAHWDLGVATVNVGYQTNEAEANEPGKSYDNVVISANGSAGPISWYVAYEENDDNVDDPTVADVAAADGGIAAVTAANHGDAYVARLLDEYQQDAETFAVFLLANLGERDSIYVEWEDSSVDGYDTLGEKNLDKNATVLGYSHKFGPGTSFIIEYASVDSDSDAAADVDRVLAVLKVDF